VQRLLEHLDFWKMRFEQVRLVVLASKIVCKLGNVIDLNVVLCLGDQGPTRTPPTIVIRFCVVNFILFLLGGRQFEKVLCQCELSVDLFLCKAKVLHIELTSINTCSVIVVR
jgi:hypothetical protein